jgi:molybdate transport system substrate-binding protein
MSEFMKRRHWFAFATWAIVALSLVAGVQVFPSLTNAQGNKQLIVSAAASLTDAMKEIEPLYRRSRPNITIRYNFASSGALQQQIENGAPVDVFISAAEKQMDTLQNKGLVVSGTRRNLLTNRMVLVVPKNSSGVNELRNLTSNSVRRIAIGNPRSVPAGQYAEQVLKKAGLWNSVQSKFVLANNVRQVLQFVEAGNAQAGLVYTTDARTSNQVKVVQTVPANLHSPIVYPMAVMKTSRNQAAARAFAQFLSGTEARKVFNKYGFGAA